MRWAALLVLFLPSVATTQAKPSPPRRSPPNLFAYSWGYIDVNRVFCFTSGYQGACSYSSEGSALSWPVPYYSQEYVFSSGLQIAGIIPSGAGFAWAGDTTGVYFADNRFNQANGWPRTDVFNSRDSAALGQWPQSAVVLDTAVYDSRLIGRAVVSQQDVWNRYWDRPAITTGIAHPMGILVDQRLMAWNYPTGNEDVLYIALTLYNVTARSAAVYANPTIPPELRAEIVAAGAAFQDTLEQSLGVQLPDGGYAFDSVYVGVFVDDDIATFSRGYGTASLPFGLGIGYDGHFRDEQGWTYPAEIFGSPPFTPAPGLLGARFLRSPAPFSLFTTFTGSAIFPSPLGVQQLWRYLAGNLTPAAGDPSCVAPSGSFTDAKPRGFCYILQVQADSRFTISSGPFTLGPGEAKTIVMAYILAAPLDVVTPFIGGDLKPGYPSRGDSIAADTTRILTIERAAGWITQNDANANGSIEANEVTTARRSLLHKAQVAQAIVDAKFLLPQAPEAPEFFLIPGDKRVTIVWQPSATEKTGDPYYALASDRSSALYDPNYRPFDVEGYRIYRGRDPRALTLIAQLDHDNTEFVDYVGALNYPGRCAPELGIVTDCPVAFPQTPDSVVKTRQRIAGKLVQVPEGARIVSTTGLVTVVRADTFPTSTSGFEPLGETGVTFAFTDSTVSNSFRYYYAVTAFDFNSIRSGPVSFESPRLTKVITPRASSGQEVGGSVQAMRLVGGDGATLDTAAPLPTLDAVTGIFSGPMPPTDGIEIAFSGFIPQLLASGSVTLRIDSIATGMANLDVLPGSSRPTPYYLTVISGTDTTHFTVELPMDGTPIVRDETAFARFGATTVDSSQAARFGAGATYALFGEATLRAPGVWRVASWGRGDANGNPLNSSFNGPRWWTGSNESLSNPNGGNCSPSSGFCASTLRVPDITRTAGRIAGVTIFHPQSYNSTPNTPGRLVEGVVGTVTRAADFRVVWGASGAIDSVIDVTHHLAVPFDTRARASWGILNQQSFASVDPALTGDTRNDLLTWSDIFCVEPVPEFTTQCGGSAQTPAVLQQSATLSAIAIRDTASSYAGTAAPSYTATGSGFIFYLNGHFFLMQLSALPPAGTVWNARFYSGVITGSAAQTNFAFEPAIRPPAVPGLRAELAFQGTAFNRQVTTDSLLARVHTVPDPFYLISGYETSPDTLALKFVHLPALAIVRIYSQSGILVQALTNDDPTGGGELTWNLLSRSGKRVASGVYFYHIETPDHRTRVGRFTLITTRGP